MTGPGVTQAATPGPDVAPASPDGLAGIPALAALRAALPAARELGLDTAGAEQVLNEASERLGYRPNEAARNLGKIGK